MLRICDQARSSETGGVLIGHYNDALNCAVVTRITGPTPGSRAGTTWFERNAKQLRDLFRRHWRRGAGYHLGEWHFRPSAAPMPSGTDTSTMRRIAADPAAQCRRPVLLIIGGEIPNSWAVSARAY